MSSSNRSGCACIVTRSDTYDSAVETISSPMMSLSHSRVSSSIPFSIGCVAASMVEGWRSDVMPGRRCAA